MLGNTSQLFELLDAVAPTEEWQVEILRAFQSWAVLGDVNIGLVADSGASFGSAGPPQGDARFGDIRIGTYPLSAEVIGVASGFDYLAGAWAGDVRLNSTYDFSIGGDNDLFSVMLHEAGHVFGLEHNDDPASALFEHLQFVTGLSEQDRIDFQEIYGSRTPDEFEGQQGNDLATTASVINNSPVVGDLTTLNDVDWFRFTVQGNSSDVTVRLRTAGISLLTARLSIYDDAGELVDTVVSSGPLDGDLELQFTRPHSSSKRFYVKIEGADESVFGIGAYQLEIDADLQDHSSQGNGPPAQEDRNDSMEQADNLLRKVNRLDARFDYFVSSSLEDAGDVDFFRFQAPNAKSSDAPPVLTVMVWGGADFQPMVELFDKEGAAIPFELLVNQGGTYTLQAQGIEPNELYYVSVRSSSGVASPYALAIDFGARAVELNTLVADFSGDLDDASILGTLHVNSSQLFHFVVETESSASGLPWQLIITTQDGAVVSRVDVPPGESLSSALYLTRGDYVFQLISNGSAVPMVLNLAGVGLTDPVGPEAVDATLSPIGAGANSQFAAWWEAGILGLLPRPEDPAPTPSSSAQPTPTTQTSTTPSRTQAQTGQAANAIPGDDQTIGGGVAAPAATNGLAPAGSPAAAPSAGTAAPFVDSVFIQALQDAVGLPDEGIAAEVAGLIPDLIAVLVRNGGPLVMQPSRILAALNVANNAPVASGILPLLNRGTGSAASGSNARGAIADQVLSPRAATTNQATRSAQSQFKIDRAMLEEELMPPSGNPASATPTAIRVQPSDKPAQRTREEDAPRHRSWVEALVLTAVLSLAVFHGFRDEMVD